jgi:CBS domain-containing protein
MKSRVAELLASKDSDIVAVSPSETVIVAVRRMNSHGIGSLPVLDAERLVGIFTERDVLVRVVEDGNDPARTLVAEVMTEEPLCVSPGATVEEAMIFITENRCRHVPIVEGGKLVGLISIGDLVRWHVRDQDVRLEDMLRSIRLASG